jgi:hypothetical protein
LAIRVARKLKAIDVIDVLSDLFILRGVPAHIRKRLAFRPRRAYVGAMLRPFSLSSPKLTASDVH